MYSTKHYSQRRIRVNKFLVVPILLVLIMIPAQPLLFQPEFKPLVVRFGNSEAENAAISELRNSFTKIEIVDVTSQDIHKKLSTTLSPIIYTGHGSDQGIMAFGQLISWEEMGNLFALTRSEHQYLLSCFSEKGEIVAAKYGIEITSFEGEIDAVVGAQIISYQIHGSRLSPFSELWKSKIIDNLMHRITHLMEGETYLPLSHYVNAVIGRCYGGSSSNTYIYDCLGFREAGARGILLITLLIGIFLPLVAIYLNPVISSLFYVLMTYYYVARLVHSIASLWLAIQNGDLAKFIVNLGTTASLLLNFASLVIGYLGFWEALTASSLLAVDSATVPARLPLIGASLLAMGLFAYEVFNLYNDLNDKDDWVR